MGGACDFQRGRPGGRRGGGACASRVFTRTIVSATAFVSARVTAAIFAGAVIWVARAAVWIWFWVARCTGARRTAPGTTTVDWPAPTNTSCTGAAWARAAPPAGAAGAGGFTPGLVPRGASARDSGRGSVGRMGRIPTAPSNVTTCVRPWSSTVAEKSVPRIPATSAGVLTSNFDSGWVFFSALIRIVPTVRLNLIERRVVFGS